jgi:hypothetical protein
MNRKSLQKQRHTNLTRAQAQSCGQKLSYDSRNLALRALRHHAQHYKGMNAYHCLICRKYHLGRQTTRLERILDSIAAGENPSGFRPSPA